MASAGPPVGRRRVMRREYSPGSPDAVALEDGISRDDREVVYQRLRGDQAIEWIPMMERQRRDPRHMWQLHRQRLEPVCRHLLRDERVQLGVEGQSAQAHLDGHLPTTGDAEEASLFRP